MESPKFRGDKVKVTLRFRGREMAHQEFGMRQLERIKADVDAIGQVEQMISATMMIWIQTNGIAPQ